MALVCHMEKYKANDCGGLQTEDNRESSAINNKNPLLDTSKTHLNKHFSYDTGNGNIIECQRSTLVDIIRYHRNRINVLKRYAGKPQLRKDAVVCCSFIIGADPKFMKKLSYKEQQEYFRCVIDYFESRGYMILEYSMHFDEGTPHMHVRIFPEIETGRLSAKEMFTPRELSRIQRELPNWLNNRNFAIEAGKEGANREHLDEMNFRAKKTEEKMQNLQLQLEKVEKRKQEETIKLQEISNQIVQADAYLQQVITRYNDIAIGLDACKKMEGLIDSIETLADVLKDEYTKSTIQSVESKCIPLAEQIRRASEVLEAQRRDFVRYSRPSQRQRDIER